MADNLDFSVQLRLLNENFNAGINQARDRFSQFTQSVERNLAQMGTDTERAEALLIGLGNLSSDRLTSELRAVADQLRQMGAGANITREQLDSAMQTAALQVTRLGRELDVARQEAVRLGQTNASPTELTEAANKVNRLEQELNGARSASTSLSNELAGAMNRASTTANDASTALYRMANIRVPETIRGEIDSISRALVDFQNNSGRPAAEIERATRAAQAEIRRLENELNGLDDTQNRVSQGSGGLGANINRLQGAFGSLQGLLAAAGLGIGIAEIIEVSDAFKTLEARVKLATGEGAAFVTGFEGVKQIANETFSSVENTGELFAKIAASAETLGLAQKDVLSVTKTINEAIQLSGGSAASAEAAIIQLNQAIASGILRGEEYNSISEQAPRLLKAMADGLGVTRGELRAMANDGKLSAEVVISALQSQSQAISDEFGTLPTTVGNSLQVLKNKLFNFIGEIDGSLNQTSKLAEAIGYIGDSLEDLDPSFIAALTGALENTIEAVVTVAKRIKETYDNITSVINSIAGGSADASEQIGLITASLHGVNIFIAAISDGIKGLVIAGDFFTGIIAQWAAMATRFYASLTFGAGKQAILELADALDKGASEALDRAHQKAMEFESGTEKAMLNAAKGAKERFAEMAADSEAAYNVMIAKGDATAEAIEGQLVKMVTDRIRANDMIVSDEDRLLLASKGLQAAISDTGDISIESAKVTQASFLGVGESFAEVALKAKESGKSIELSLTEAIHKAHTKEAVDDIVLSLHAMANQGVITGKQLELGANIAKTQYENIDKQLQQNIERFAEYATAELNKTNGATLADIQRAAALEGLAVQATETGGILVTQLDKSTIASTRTKEQIDELAGAVGIGLSKEFIKSSTGLEELVSGFDDLGKAGYDAGGALVDSLTAMSDKASNTVEIEALIVKWNELYKEGKITGQELAEGLEGVQNRADILKDGINGVTEAYGFLGLKTREELAKDAQAYTESYSLVMKQGELTAQQQEEVFTKTAKANIAANGGVIDSFTRAQAAAKGYTVEVDENGRVVVEKAGQAVSANDRVKTSVDRVTSSHRNLASSAGSAGNEMVNAASRTFTAYEKLQEKIKGVKEAMALENADTTLQNLRIYGKEEAPAIGGNLQNRTSIEGFLKSAGLSAEQAMEETRKLFASAGNSSGGVNWNKVNGFQEGQVLTANDLAKYKSPSVYLSELAEKARLDAKRSEDYQAKLERNRERNSSSNGQSSSNYQSAADQQAEEKSRADIYYRYRQAELEREKANGLSGQALEEQQLLVQSAANALRNAGGYVPQPQLPQSALDAVANLSRQQSYNVPTNNAATKKIELDLTYNGNRVSTEMPADQEGLLMSLVQALQDSKAIAGK